MGVGSKNENVDFRFKFKICRYINHSKPVFKSSQSFKIYNYKLNNKPMVSSIPKRSQILHFFPRDSQSVSKQMNLY